MVNDSTQNLTLGEATGRFLLTLPEAQRAPARQEINKFTQWYGGREKLVSGISAEAVSKYAEHIAQTDSDSASKIASLKAFLNYAKKEGWSKENLGLGLKVVKAKGKTAKAPTRLLVREPVPLTQARYDEIVDELAKLKTRRIEAIGEITRAAADKDFKENVPFHAAREHKSFLDGKILELEETLELAVITEGKQEHTQGVCIGNAIILQDPGSGAEMRCMLVNPKEVAPGLGKISVISPVGKAALGKREGDTITVIVPAGKKQYVIKKIER